jgi:hypothetical protein
MNDLDFDFGDVAACQRLIQRYAHATAAPTWTCSLCRETR